MARKQFIIAVVASVLLHIVMLFVFGYLQDISFPSDSVSAIEVFLQKPDGGWQIADILKPLREERPDKARFLGMYDQSTGEETVAPSHEGRRMPARQSSSGGKDVGRRTWDEGRSTKDEGVAAKLALPNSRASSATTNGAPQGSRAEIPEDFYPDYKYGEHTYINVLRYPEVEYFVRLKRIFKMTWDPVSALRAQMPVVSVSRGTISAVVAVSVDSGGGLSELFVLKSSGIAVYDNEAVRTVRASSPFASPPEKFLEDDGFLRMSWTFVVYL